PLALGRRALRRRGPRREAGLGLPAGSRRAAGRLGRRRREHGLEPPGAAAAAGPHRERCGRLRARDGRRLPGPGGDPEGRRQDLAHERLRPREPRRDQAPHPTGGFGRGLRSHVVESPLATTIKSMAVTPVKKLDAQKVRADFPIFEQTFHGKPLAYLDSANSSQKPRQVLEAMTTFYETSYANVHRAVYELAERATEALEGS